MIDELSRKNAEQVFSRPKKTLQNYKSGLNSYLEFLIEYSFSIESITVDEADPTESQVEDLQIITDKGIIVSENNADKKYSKSDLSRNFRLRIKTQDRFYEEIFFPIRFINRVFSIRNERNVFQNWLSNLLDSINIFLEENKITFKEITSLTITNKKVYIAHKGKDKLAYTKLSDNKTLVPFDVSTLNKIAIDHERSLFEVMNINLSRLPTILQITNELKRYINGKVTYKKLSKASHSSNLDEFIETVDTRSLLKELELIASATNLQLMDGSQNTSKGKKTR